MYYRFILRAPNSKAIAKFSTLSAAVAACRVAGYLASENYVIEKQECDNITAYPRKHYNVYGEEIEQ